MREDLSLNGGNGLWRVRQMSKLFSTVRMALIGRQKTLHPLALRDHSASTILERYPTCGNQLASQWYVRNLFGLISDPSYRTR